jgi:hypothetical protein
MMQVSPLIYLYHTFVNIPALIIPALISLYHTFVNIPALISKRSVFLSSRAGIFTKVWLRDMIFWNVGRKWPKVTLRNFRVLLLQYFMKIFTFSFKTFFSVSGSFTDVCCSTFRLIFLYLLACNFLSLKSHTIKNANSCWQVR